MNKKIINLVTLFILVAFNPVIKADDTDIYFPPTSNSTDPGRHNVLFIMDVSGSMRSLSSDNNETRFEAMEQAFDQIISTAPENINVGLMNFGSIGSSRNSFAQGVKFPISPIGGNAQEILEARLPNNSNGNPDWNASNIPNPGANKIVRTYLSEIVETWSPSGWTPLVDSLYEAALYFRGEKVAWGTGPEAETNNNWVAHPATYTGSLSGWNPAACTDTITERLPQGEVPSEYRCPDPASSTALGTWENCAATVDDCAADLGGGGNGLASVNATLTLSGSWNHSGGRNPTSSSNPVYTFTVTQNSSVEINLEGVRHGNNRPDTYLYLLDSGGNLLEEDDDGGIWPNSKIIRHLTVGTYQLVVATYENNESGNFDLKIEGHVSNLTDPSGNSHTAFGGSWTSSGGRDATSSDNPSYDFTVNSSGTVHILLRTSYPSDAYLYLLDSNGTIIDHDDDSALHSHNPPYGRDSYLAVNLDAGDYKIVATTYNAGKTDHFKVKVKGNISNLRSTGSELRYPSARYVKLKSLSEVNGNPWTTVAEIDLIDENNQEMDQSQWSIESFDSQEMNAFQRPATHAIDNNPNTIWTSQLSTNHSHEIVIDLGSTQSIKGFKYLPRQNNAYGRINAYEVYFTDNLNHWGVAVATGNFPDETAAQTLSFPRAIYGSSGNGGNGTGSGNGSGNGGKVLMCHIPPGNPSNAHTISISVAAVPAHLAHGDEMGECPVAKLGHNKVTICHIPPGNPDNAHTITISRNALPAHINNHGDNEGDCGTVSGGTWTGQTPGTCAYTMCAGGITEEPTYITPIKAECQSNTIILLSDGKPENASWISVNPTYEKVANGDWTGGFASIFDQLNCESSPSDFIKGRCGPELTSYLATHDNNSDMTGDQLINTYTIGLGLGAGSKAEEYLQSLSTVDDAETTGIVEGYYSASNQQQLVSVFSNIISNIQTRKTTTSFSNPGYSIVAKNGLNHEDSVYIPVFEPGEKAVWKGNLKKFKFVNANGKRTIQGKNNLDAMTEMSAITTTALDFWSASESTPDGDDISAGGVINKLDPESRNLYSDISGDDLSASTNAISINNIQGNNNQSNNGGNGSNNGNGNSNGNISSYMLGLTSSTSNNEMKNYLCFIRGYENYDTSSNECGGENRKHMGDMLHFEPIIVTYDKEHDDHDDSTHHQVLFAGTNEGYLHAFDTHTGEEIFAFMPESLLKNIKPQYENTAYRGHQYGIDGLATVWKNDENHDGVINNDDSVILYFGLRRGGNIYYALDITDLSAPTVKWKIEGGSGNFEHLGQTWSRPYFARIHTSSSDKTLKEVIVFSGGYDAENQDKSREGENSRQYNDQKGNDVFIVDAKTGNFIWSIQKGTDGTGITGHNALNNSIPGGVRLLDLDRDGAIDRLYFADVKGNVWRVELDTDLTDTDSDTSSLYDLADAKLIKFADFSGITDDTTEYRKFFSEPDVSIIRTGTSQSLLISLGSGDRTRPLDTDVTNRFYVLKDEHLYSPLPENFETITDEDTGDDSDLLAVTISNSENGIAVDNPITAGGIFKSDKKGWYLNFGSEGEKVLADSTTSHGKVLFTTIVPNVYANSESGVNCNLPEIQGRAYVINILTGASMVDLSGNGGNPNNNDLYTIISANEIPGNIQVIFNEPSASDGGQCTAANCVQYVDLRIGKKRSQITSYNSGILESVYWSQSQGQ